MSLADLKKARVAVEIDGVDYELIPSPDAIITLSGKYDGLAPLIGAIQRLNVKAMGDTVVAGLGLEGKAAREMMMSVACTPLLELLPQLSTFASILTNGGRPLTQAADDKDDQEGDKGPL
ncbi:hypothetical protein EN781_00120 [Mesorhizobium sp. M4A.F.Ca.ET.090.04.2.1]|uniref:hypothetical protein n=1 Tax=Mesorhizobium sp. M4A.F.Ca.ET.090.04.2.1 TaxID=2496663 RepID=UPI000FCB48D3|nr:hypothetical protein [Mesorhizobium sp. M4A.F.Ca.ET.090.04.2.1]RVC47577.1 hypothetical protein EN781_00120 [Mesorhizobium sp. M4A.F.Ca.ET.090.04.2.1]